MAQFQKSALIKKKEDVLFVTNSKGSFSSSLLRKVEEQLNNSDVSRVVFYFDEKSEHEKSMIEDICSLLVCYPDLEAKVFRRKNILFLQRPLFEKERLIRFPQGKIISKPGKFIYEGMLFKPKSRLYETILNTIIVDQPRVVQFSIPVRKSEETNEEFLRHTADIRFLYGILHHRTASDDCTIGRNQFFGCTDICRTDGIRHSFLAVIDICGKTRTIRRCN